MVKGATGKGKMKRTEDSRTVKRVVRSMIEARVEHKCMTTSPALNVAPATAGNIHRLGNLAQGDDFYQRSGDVVLMRDLKFKFHASVTTATNANCHRIIILSDSMANGALLTVPELLDTSSYLSMLNIVNQQRHRFKIYYDRLHSVVSTSSIQEVSVILDYKLNKSQFFNDGTANATSVGKNAIYAIVISQNTNGLYNWNSSLTYTDS